MRRITTCVVALALVAAACGGDDGGGGQAQTEEGAVEAVEAANAAALNGNAGGVFNFLSAECRATVDDDDVRLAISLIPVFFDDLVDGFDLDDIEVQASIVSYDGDTARVDITYVAPDGADVETLGLSSDTVSVMYENGKWVDTDCEFEDTTERDAENLQGALDELGFQGTREDPIPGSVAAPVGGGFVVAVDAIDTDALTALEQSGGFTSEPEPGEQLVLISLTIGFGGPDEPEGVSNLNAQVIGGSSNVGIDNFGCGSFPSQLSNRSIKMFEGGVTTGDICFAVPSDDISGLQLSLQGGFSTDRQIIFDPSAAADSPVPVTGSRGPAPDGELTAARQSPTPLAEPVDLGEGWTITIVGIEPDATATITGANDFNEPPAAGFVYSLVEYELSYDGEEQSASGFAVTVDVVGDSNVSGIPNCNVGDVPDEIDRFTDVFKGGSIAGNQCFVVDASDLDSLVVIASADFFSDDAFVLALR
jgi:hypothetical protein